MALKFGSPTSAALDISIGPKATNSNGLSSLKAMDTLSVGSLHQFRNPCSMRRTSCPPAIAAYKAEESQSSDESGVAGSSLQSQLDLLERLTSNSTVNLEGSRQPQVSSKKTIREQLSELVNDDVIEATIPLGKRFKPNTYKDLTISQKRNIKRQDYLNKVAKRNDIPFFATIALFVILPPTVILGVAVASGYVDLFP